MEDLSFPLSWQKWNWWYITQQLSVSIHIQTRFHCLLVHVFLPVFAFEARYFVDTTNPPTPVSSTATVSLLLITTVHFSGQCFLAWESVGSCMSSESCTFSSLPSPSSLKLVEVRISCSWIFQHFDGVIIIISILTVQCYVTAGIICVRKPVFLDDVDVISSAGVSWGPSLTTLVTCALWSPILVVSC